MFYDVLRCSKVYQARNSNVESWEAASRRQVMGPVLLRYGFSPDKRGSAELRRGSSVPCSVGGMGVKMCETVKVFKSDTTRKKT